MYGRRVELISEMMISERRMVQVGAVGEVRIELEERFEQVWRPGAAFRATLEGSGRFV